MSAIERRTYINKAGKMRTVYDLDFYWKPPGGGRAERIRKVLNVSTRRIAEECKQEIERGLLLGEWPRKEENEKKPTATFATFAPRFLDFCASPRASRRGANRPGELREKERTLEQHLLPFFGERPLSEASNHLADDYVALKSKEGLAPKTIANHLAILRRLLNLAARWDEIPNAPHIEAPVIKQDRIEADQFLDFEEAKKFVACARPEDRIMMFFALETGARLGELRGLKWSNLELENAGGARSWRPRVHVVQQLTRYGHGPTKGAKRSIPIGSKVVEALHGQPKRSEYVFTRRCGKPLTRGRVDYRVRRAGELARLTKAVHPHMLRHTFVSHRVMRGVPIFIVQRWAGHADIKQTLRYAHLAPAEEAAWIDHATEERRLHVVTGDAPDTPADKIRAI